MTISTPSAATKRSQRRQSRHANKCTYPQGSTVSVGQVSDRQNRNKTAEIECLNVPNLPPLAPKRVEVSKGLNLVVSCHSSYRVVWQAVWVCFCKHMSLLAAKESISSMHGATHVHSLPNRDALDRRTAADFSVPSSVSSRRNRIPSK